MGEQNQTRVYGLKDHYKNGKYSGALEDIIKEHPEHILFVRNQDLSRSTDRGRQGIFTLEVHHVLDLLVTLTPEYRKFGTYRKLSAVRAEALAAPETSDHQEWGQW